MCNYKLLRKILLCCIVALLALECASCTKFGTEQLESVNGRNGIASTESLGGNVENPGADFYSLTMPESYERYGVFSFNSTVDYNLRFDGKYFYGIMFIESAEENGIQTLGRYEYPDGEYRPVCTDPTCTHASGSGCPLAGCRNMFACACYEGYIYFVSPDAILYMYLPLENRSVQLLKNCYEARFIRSNGNLWLIYHDEDADFSGEYICCRISEAGKITELGGTKKLLTADTRDREVYEDRYIVDSWFINTENEHTAFAVMCDLESDEVSVVFERDCPELDGFDPEDISCYIAPYMIYGDKLLLRVNYAAFREVNDEEFELIQLAEFWLVDLKTGEKRMLCFSNNDDIASFKCLYSEKCILYTLPRRSEDEDFIIHILYPKTGEEETYDLSAMAAEIGEKIPLDNYMTALNKGALKLQIQVELDEPDEYGNDRAIYTTFEFDLASGRVFKYALPEEDQ